MRLTLQHALAPQDKCFPQTIAVCQTRASGLGLTVKVSDEASFEYGDDVCGVMVQYPATDGRVLDYSVCCLAMYLFTLLCVQWHQLAHQQQQPVYML